VEGLDDTSNVLSLPVSCSVLRGEETLMRSLKMVLTMVSVLGMAGITLAGTAINIPGLHVTWEYTAGFHYPNLHSYTVRVGGVAAFADVKLLNTPTELATVSQATKFELLYDEATDTEYESPISTPWLISMPTAHKAIDTHFLFAMPGVLVPGSTFTETNDKSNPAGIATVSGYYAGLGTFNTTGGFAFGEPLADGTPFMQIVLPASVSAFWLRMTVPINGVDTVVDIWPEPEPGTIAMLIGGALCLVVVRFRRVVQCS
jgi:hypothetical protein